MDAILEILKSVDLNQVLVFLMFGVFVALLFRGVQVAFALVGVAMLFVLLAMVLLDPFSSTISKYVEFSSPGISYRRLAAVSGRFFGSIIKNPVLVALPMFIFMGLMLDKSGIAQRMMRAMQVLFGTLKGGLALSVMLIGIILAASTGVIGASVVLLGVIGIPAMMKQNYDKSILTGTIAASGTLGILIPPSIMLVIMSDQLAISLGDLFMGALFPGLLLGALYVTYLIIHGLVKPQDMPIPDEHEPVTWDIIKTVLLLIIPPFGLIMLVLGSIFFGLATPTEASGLGAAGATLLALGSKKLNLSVLRDVSRETLITSGYIVGIFIAANFFAFILRRYGGDEIIESMLLGTFDDPYLVIAFILFVIFLLGFLLDWIEITLIIMPLILPAVLALNIPIEGFDIVDDPSVVWFAILAAITLQTSFLTPPVGFALFYLKGVCPPDIKISDVYKGVIPFVCLQLLALIIVFFWPELATWLPAQVYGK